MRDGSSGRVLAWRRAPASKNQATEEGKKGSLGWRWKKGDLVWMREVIWEMFGIAVEINADLFKQSRGFWSPEMNVPRELECWREKKDWIFTMEVARHGWRRWRGRQRREESGGFCGEVVAMWPAAEKPGGGTGSQKKAGEVAEELVEKTSLKSVGEGREEEVAAPAMMARAGEGVGAGNWRWEPREKKLEGREEGEVKVAPEKSVVQILVKVECSRSEIPAISMLPFANWLPEKLKMVPNVKKGKILRL